VVILGIDVGSPSGRAACGPGRAPSKPAWNAYEAGELAAAAEHFADTLRSETRTRSGAQLRGRDRLRTGRYREALEHFECARMLDPQNAEYHFGAAVAHRELGTTEAGREYCETALALDPGWPPRTASSRGAPQFSRTFYLEIISMLHAHLRPRTYLEIGVESGQSIALARRETRAIGIDPSPRSQSSSLPARASAPPRATNTSQSTTCERSSAACLLILLSSMGCTNSNLRLRDFINIEKHCTSRSTILIHDCYPVPRTAERERRTTFWSGDIWRLILILRKYRPDLSVKVIGTAPTGLGVVRRLDPVRTPPAELRGDRRGVSGVDYSVLDADRPDCSRCIQRLGEGEGDSAVRDPGRRSIQHAHDRTGNTGRERSGDDGFSAQGNDLVAALRGHGPPGPRS